MASQFVLSTNNESGGQYKQDGLAFHANGYANAGDQTRILERHLHFGLGADLGPPGPDLPL